MARLWTIVVVAGVLMGHASPGLAQPAEPSVLPSHSIPAELAWLSPDYSAFMVLAGSDFSDLQRWVTQFKEWQEWSSRWRGQREPGWLTAYRERRQKPSPPTWLPARCETVLDETEPLSTACTLLTMWGIDDLAQPTILTSSVVGMSRERPEHVTWWEHLHLDVLWPDLQVGSSTYGVVGIHHATTVKGRLQVFTAPGALLLNLPSYNGARTWKMAVNYGMGYRLVSFSLFGKRPAELHVNFAKTWIVSDTTDLVVGRSIDVVGFSITFKRAQ